MRDPEWPHGVRCARCDRDISRIGEPKIPQVEEPGDPSIGVILCAECWTSASNPPLIDWRDP